MDDEHLNNQTILRINPAVIEAEASKSASLSHLGGDMSQSQQSLRVSLCTVEYCYISNFAEVLKQ